MVDGKTIEELVTKTSDISDIIKSEAFSTYVIQEAVKGRKLAGVVSATQEKLAAGDGATVKIPVFPTIAAAQLNEGSPISLTDYSAMSQAVTVKRYGSGSGQTDESIYQAAYPLVRQVLDAMSRGLADAMDAKIAYELGIQDTPVNFTPESTQTVSALSGVYGAVKSIIAALGAKGFPADTLIIDYETEGALLTKAESQTPYSISVADGRVSKVLGLNVIVTNYACGSPGCADFSSANSGDGIAVVLNSKAACAEAFGQGALFEEKRDPQYAKYQHFLNSWWGVSEIAADLDEDSTDEAFGIGLITKA